MLAIWVSHGSMAGVRARATASLEPVSMGSHTCAGKRGGQRGSQRRPEATFLCAKSEWAAAGTCALAGASASAAASYAGCAAAGGAAVSNGAVQDAARALFTYTNATCSYPSARPSAAGLPASLLRACCCDSV